MGGKRREEERKYGREGDRWHAFGK